jgi:hypothetical protein
MPYTWVAPTNLEAHVSALVTFPPTVQALAALIEHNLTCLLVVVSVAMSILFLPMSGYPHS